MTRYRLPSLLNYCGARYLCVSHAIRENGGCAMVSGLAAWASLHSHTHAIFVLNLMLRRAPHSPFIHNKNQINEIWASSSILRPTNNNRRGAVISMVDPKRFFWPTDSHSRIFFLLILTDCIKGELPTLVPSPGPTFVDSFEDESKWRIGSHNKKTRQWTLSHHRCI